MARRTTYLPTTDAGMKIFSDNFRGQLPRWRERTGCANVTPAMVAAFDEAQAAYAEAYRLAHGTATRTPSVVARKNEDRRRLVAHIRRLVALVQACPQTTDQDRTRMKLTVRKRTRSRVPAPGSVPRLSLEPVDAWRVGVAVRDERRPFAKDKPEGVHGLQLFVAVGEVMPLNPEGWTYAGVHTRCRFTAELPAAARRGEAGRAGGRRVWWIGRWVNPCGEPGPWGKATSVFTQRVEGGVARLGNASVRRAA